MANENGVSLEQAAAILTHHGFRIRGGEPDRVDGGNRAAVYRETQHGAINYIGTWPTRREAITAVALWVGVEVRNG